MLSRHSLYPNCCALLTLTTNYAWHSLISSSQYFEVSIVLDAPRHPKNRQNDCWIFYVHDSPRLSWKSEMWMYPLSDHISPSVNFTILSYSQNTVCRDLVVCHFWTSFWRKVDHYHTIVCRNHVVFHLCTWILREVRRSHSTVSGNRAVFRLCTMFLGEVDHYHTTLVSHPWRTRESSWQYHSSTFSSTKTWENRWGHRHNRHKAVCSCVGY